MEYQRLNDRLILWVRLLLGLQYVLGGLNWWYKILPFPSIGDPITAANKHAVLMAMIETGWMFQTAKIIELLTGIALLCNRYVPLMLVVSFPVALATFMLDALIWPELSGFIAGEVSFALLWSKILDLVFFGGCVMLMQGFLMFAFIDRYKPMLVAKAEPTVP